MVDGEFAPLHDKIKAAIAKVVEQPIKYLVNTHFHGDHTGGNAPFAKDGAIVVAQDNVQEAARRGHDQRPHRRQDAARSSRRAADQDLYATRCTLKVKGRTALPRAMSHNAHTDGDTYVWFTDANVLVDRRHCRRIGRYPNIDFANGGNIKGMIAARRHLSEARQRQDQDRAGPRPARQQGAVVEAIARCWSTARDRMAKLVKDGKSEAEVIAAKPFADYDKKMGVTDQQSTNFIRVVYHSLAEKPPGKTASQ